MDAYTTCNEVLSQLGETIPQSLDAPKKKKMIEATSKMTRSISDTDLLEMKEMDERLSISLKFYSFMTTLAFFAKPEIFAFLSCRMVQLTMQNGICKYSIMGFVQYAMMLCCKRVKDIKGASQIGKAAMSLPDESC